jgi:hypothetical protein
MAISLITGGALTGAVNNGGAVTLTFPAGVLQDDVVYVCSGIDGTPTIATSGYTAVSNVTSSNQQTWVWRKIMGATPDTSVTINGTGQPQDAHTVVALILRGVETSQPEDAASTTASGSSTNPDNPAITTVFNRAWVLAFASSRVLDSTITAPSGYTNQTNIAQTDTNPSTTGVATKEITTAGTEDPPSWTDWATGTWGAITVAVRPGGFISVPVTGVSGTGEVGTVQVFENEQVSVTGLSATGAVGTVSVAFPIQILVTGESATAAVGDVTVTAKASVDIPFGVVGVTQLGDEDIRIPVQFSVTGVSATAEEGDINFRFGTVVYPDGVLCTAELGQIAVWITVNDEQTLSWIPVNDGQTPAWVQVLT